MTHKRLPRQLVFEFTGKLEHRDGMVVALDDNAALMAYGVDEDQALDRMQGVIEAYLETLDDRGEIPLAITMGKLKPVMAPTPSPEPSPDWATPRLGKVDSRFVAQIPTLAAV